MAATTDSRSARKSQARALLVFIVVMLGIAGGAGWLFGRGLAQGETWFPSPRSSSRRVVERIREPVTFWMAVGGYGLLCGAAAGFAAWLAREGFRGPDGVFRRRGLDALGDGSGEDRTSPRSLRRETLTLDNARALVAQTASPQARAAADRLLNEAMALPQRSPEDRAAALLRMRGLDAVVPDYELSSFGARLLEMIGDSSADPLLRKAAYSEARELAIRYAAGASSGGEGTARSRHGQEIEAKLQALEAGARVASPLPPRTAPAGTWSPPSVQSGRPSAPRPASLTAIGWFFVLAGGLATPVSMLAALMILGGGDGSSGGSFLGGLIVIGGPPATLICGIGLLLRRRWAYFYALVVLVLFAGHSLVQVVRGSTPERSTVSPSGVTTTVLASSPSYAVHALIIAVAIGLLVKLCSAGVRAQFAHGSRRGSME